MIELKCDCYELLAVRERNTNFPATFLAFCGDGAASVGDIAIIDEESVDVLGVANGVPATAISLMIGTEEVSIVSAVYRECWTRVAKEENHENN